MRPYMKILALAAVIALGYGAFSGLIAETRTPDARGLLGTIAAAGGRAVAHVPVLGTRISGAGHLFGRQEPPAQSQKGGAKAVATVQTDRADYPPNTQVNVTGSGWFGREVVELTFTETATTPPGGYTDGPFVFYATSDDEGRIANGEFSTDMHDVGVTFVLTARGSISGLTAQTTFTDAISTYATFFELDGNAASTAGGAPDWDRVYSDFAKTTTNAAGTAAINFYNDPVPVAVPGVPAQTEDTYSGGNSKDIADISAWTYNSSPPQNKANLENAIAAAYVDRANFNHTYLYVGADRFDNSGSMALGVWFLQTPIGQSGGRFYTLRADGSVDTSSPAHHVDGDLLLVANFSSGSATITSFKWNAATGTIPSTGTTLSSTIGTAVVNTGALDGAGGRPPAVPWPYKSSASGNAANFVQNGQFFEAGVDLNLLFPGQTNFNFSSFIVETRSSTSATATLSDIIVGHVSTAPDVQVTKAADKSTVDAGSQVGFTVTVANVGAGDLANITLNDPLPSGAGNDIVWGIPTGGDPSNSFVLSGTVGNQTLGLNPNLGLPYNSTPISVHIVGTSTSGDVGTLTNTATVAAGNEDAAFSSNNQSSASIAIVNSGLSTVTPQSAVEGTPQTFAMGTFTSSNSGTATVVVNWGDGSTTSTFTFVNMPNVALVIPATSHTYAEEGSYTVTETITLAGSVKVGSFIANVSDPSVIAAGVSPISKTYDGLIVGTRNLATFTDPGGAEPLGSDYSATVDWGGSFGTTAGTITYSGTLGSKTGVFTVSASVPYKDAGTYHPTVTIYHEASTPQTVIDTATINPASLTITADSVPATQANDAFAKTYDGQVYTGFTVRYDGFVNGETPTVLGGTLTFTGAATTTTAVGGPYTVTPGGRMSNNYTINYVSGTLTIAQAPLTITADANPATQANDAFAKTYDGQVYTGFTVRYDGFVNGETPAVLAGTLTFAGAGTTTTAAGGPYTVMPGGQTSNNYAINYVSGSLTIAQAPLTVTADANPATQANDAFAKTYDGQVYTGFTVRYDGFVNGETSTVLGGTLIFTGAGTTTSAAGGPYAVTPEGKTSGNYAIAFVSGSLTIAQAPLLVVAASEAFDEGNVDPTDLTASYSGFVNGETLETSGIAGSPNLTTTATSASAPGGSYPIVAAAGTLSAGNYSFLVSGGSVTIVDVAPAIVMSTGPIRLAPGDGFTRPGTFSDPGVAVPTETWTITTDYGDGSPVEGPATTVPGAVSIGHVYPTAGQYTVTVTIADNYGASSQLSFTVTVAMPPTLTVDHGATTPRNTAFPITGHFVQATAAGGYVINWGDPAGDSGSNPNVQASAVAGAAGDFGGAHSYKHKGTYNVAVTFTDGNGDNVTVRFDVVVN